MEQNKKYILYLTKASPVREYKISEAIKQIDENIDIIAVAFSRRFSNHIVELNNQKKVFKEIYDYTEFVNNNKELVTKTNSEYDIELRNKEEFYDLSTLSLAIYADRFLVHKDEYFIKSNLFAVYAMYEEIFKKYTVAAIVGEISSATDYIAYYMAKQKQIKYINLLHARHENKIVFTNIRDEWDGLKEKYLQNLDKGLEEEQKKITEEFINNYIKRKLQPDYMKFNDLTQKSNRNRDNIKNLTYKMKEQFKSIKIDREYAIDYNHIISDKIKQKLKNKINILSDNKNKKYFSIPNPQEKYLLFPLHFQPEASTMTLAPYYLNQMALIENISKSLPIDYKLYVKEHKVMFGLRERSFYERLCRLYNVELIDSRIDIHDLINNSQGVIAITNTTGWEAIIYDKPIYVFGNVFYDIYRYAYKISHIESFTKLIKHNEKVWNEEKSQRSKNRLSFINAVEGILLEGNLNDHMRDERVLDRENMLVIAKHIINILLNI